MKPLTMLAVATALYLGGLGLEEAVMGRLMVGRVLGAAEVLAAILLAWPRTRRIGAVAMIGVLAGAVAHHLLAGGFPLTLVFDAAVCLALALPEPRLKPAA